MTSLDLSTINDDAYRVISTYRNSFNHMSEVNWECVCDNNMHA